MPQVKRPSPAKAAAYALAAMRETYEETGLMLGAPAPTARSAPCPKPGGHSPTPASCPISAPSISSPAPSPRPTGRGASTAASSPPTSPPSPTASKASSAPDAELVELVWLPITDARRLDMPGITAVVLEELRDRIAAGMSHDHPVPLYRMLHKRFVREIL